MKETESFRALWLQYLLTPRTRDFEIEMLTLLEEMRKSVSRNHGPEFNAFLWDLPGYAEHMQHLYATHQDLKAFRQFLPQR